jgi:multicomponent K+:H+ antiporter subunit E
MTTANSSASFWQRAWPRPVLSCLLWVLWLLLVNELSAGQMLLALFWAWLIPFYTHSFWPGVMSLRRPWLALKFFSLVVWDILVANWVVARLILRPADRLQPAFMILPLDVREDFTITLLASTISLTPGTVSADLSIDRRHLLIHALHVDNEQEAIAQIKQRYEAPLKEIFEC